MADIDPQLLALEARMAADGVADFWALPPQDARVASAQRRLTYFPGPDIAVASVTDVRIPGPGGEIPLRIQRPLVENGSTVVYFHGGGWSLNSIDTNQPDAARLADRTQAVVVQVGYRLAPEHIFPAAVDDAIAAMDWVVTNIASLGGDTTRIAVAGDSAGGNIAAVLALHCRDVGIPLAAQLLVYAAVDMTNLEYLGIEWDYLGRDSALALDPRVSPALADSFVGVAPAVIGVGSHDWFTAANARYAQQLRDAGVRVIHHEYPTMPHGFFDQAEVSDAALAATEELCADLASLIVRRVPSPEQT